MCLGKDVIEISSDRNEGSGDWDSPDYKDITGSGGKKEPEALVFHKMDTEVDSDRYIAQCFVNGLYASDGDINLEKNDNLISNNYAAKLCLKYEVRKGKKLVKKELMVLLRGEIYFVQFIINPEEDELEPRLIFRRSFLHSANAIVNFWEGIITIQLDFDPFLFSSDEEGNPNLDNLETLIDFDFDEVPQTEIDLPPMVCKMGKGSRNKKKIMENIMYFNDGAGPSSSVRTPLTQEEAERKALAHRISMRYEMLEEARPIIETLVYNDKYKKLFDKIWADKVRLDGKIKLEEERALTSGAYDYKVGSSCAKRFRNVETVEEALLPYVHHEFLEWSGCSREAKSQEIDNMLKISLKEAETREEIFFYVAWVRAFNIREPIYLELCREFYATYEFDEVCADDKRLGLYHADELEEKGFDTYFQGGRLDMRRFKGMICGVKYVLVANDIEWLQIWGWGDCKMDKKKKEIEVRRDSQICCGQFISKIARKSRVLTEEIIRSLSTPVYCRDLDRTTLRELIDSEDRLIPDIPVDDVQRVAAQRAPRVQRASMQDLYERMGSMEIRQEAIERMEYRQSYHWDRYQGVFEHMAGVYSVPLQGAYNPPGYAQPQYDQYYQQYYPQQPPQQQHDDEEDE
ncbi:hypothetical protein Tco_0685094 [Tanacetum coccineum]